VRSLYNEVRDALKAVKKNSKGFLSDAGGRSLYADNESTLRDSEKMKQEEKKKKETDTMLKGRKKNVNDYSRFDNLEDSDDEKEKEEERKKKEKVTKKPARSPPKKKAMPKKKSPSKSKVDSDSDDDDDDHLNFQARGYKTKADGTKVDRCFRYVLKAPPPSPPLRPYLPHSASQQTTYFNNDMTEETKKLIGSTAPKKISKASSVASVPTTTGSQSVWNSAGTWEEKDHTKWATRAMQSCLEEGSSELGEGGIGVLRFVKVEDFEGSASTPIIRGKKRWIYEWSFKVNWELQMEGDARKFTGYSVVTDVGSVEELELSENKLKTALAGKAKDIFSPPSKLYKEVTGVVGRCLGTFEGQFHKR
jgi:hypothetical protein